MTMPEIYDLAMRLPENQREELAFLLLDSIESDPPPGLKSEAEWEATIRQRMEDIESGNAKVVGLDEAMRRIRSRPTQK